MPTKKRAPELPSVQQPLDQSPAGVSFRTALACALATAVFILPGCSPGDLLPRGSKTSVTIYDGGGAEVTIRRPGYALAMETDGPVGFTADESDVATLRAGGEFTLSEKLAGVSHAYEVRERDGELLRSYARDDETLPFDASARAWLAEALPRMFRESSFDAEARLARLLARGGPGLVLNEVERASNDSVKRTLLVAVAGQAAAEPALTERYRALAAVLNEHERRQALQSLEDAAR